MESMSMVDFLSSEIMTTLATHDYCLSGSVAITKYSAIYISSSSYSILKLIPLLVFLMTVMAEMLHYVVTLRQNSICR